jgi:hypothetical protein
MANTENKRKILTVLMESPFYFTIPLQKRLEFITFFSQQSTYFHIRNHDELLVDRKSNRISKDSEKR